MVTGLKTGIDEEEDDGLNLEQFYTCQICVAKFELVTKFME
mgnify:CR=1 FL=1